jgi:Flp pilus assembly protein TadB
MRQNGGVASTCIHGFAPGTCLICQTLQGGTATATKEDSGRGRQKRGRSDPAPVAVAVRPDRVTPPEPRHSSGLGLKMFGLLALAVVAIVGAWIIVGLVLAVLHIVELIAAALVAGWIGWMLGVHHGRRSRT